MIFRLSDVVAGLVPASRVFHKGIEAWASPGLMEQPRDLP